VVRRSLTLEEWAEQLRTFELTALRLELQPKYVEPGDPVGRFLAGERQNLDEVPEYQAWAGEVRALAEAGPRVERVRVHGDPPNAYRRWERWAARQTIEAGERIRYMSRGLAYDVGLLPAAGPHDWWLLDDARLVVMHFDAGRLVDSELVDDPDRIAQACRWWDLAVRHSVRDIAEARLH
jgi:hypothetical protein